MEGTGKREEEAASRGKRCPLPGHRFPAVPGSGGGAVPDGMLGKREELWTRTVSKVASGKRASPNDPTGRQARRAPDADRVPERPAGRDRWATEDSPGLFSFRLVEL